MKHTHGEKWNEETIKKEIYDIVDVMGINRMPTRVEIESYDKLYKSII